MGPERTCMTHTNSPTAPSLGLQLWWSHNHSFKPGTPNPNPNPLIRLLYLRVGSETGYNTLCAYVNIVHKNVNVSMVCTNTNCQRFILVLVSMICLEFESSALEKHGAGGHVDLIIGNKSHLCSSSRLISLLWFLISIITMKAFLAQLILQGRSLL